MTRRLQSLALTLTLTLSPFSSDAAHARRKCQALFVSSIGSFKGPVRVAFATGQDVPFDVQYALVRLSEVVDSSMLSDRVVTAILPKTPAWARRVLIFSGKQYTAELAISRTGKGLYISANATSLMTRKTRKLGADVKLDEHLSIQKVDRHLALHMRAIHNLFLIENAVERADYIRLILSWVKASGESPFTGNLVALFVASRGEKFFLDRGFEKDGPTFLSEEANQKMAAIAFLVQQNLTYSPGAGKEAPGIYQNIGYDQWVRISMSDDRPPKDQTVLLFQAMANAGFIFESGVYQNSIER